MTIIFRKKEGKPHAMQCIRDGGSGSQTWQRSDDFYIFHDLIHYAIETTLRLENGFFGMLKNGVSIHDFEGPREQRPALSRDAIWAETLAGTFQHEFGSGQGPFEDFNEVWRHSLRLMGVEEELSLSDAQLQAIRQEIRRLLQLWKETSAGGSLELVFY